jgi:hypothetical protein
MSADTGKVYSALPKSVIDGFGTNGAQTSPVNPLKLVNTGVAPTIGVDDPSYNEKNTLELPIDPALNLTSLPDW